MHDIKLIRDNPEAFDAGLKARGLAPQSSALVALDERRRKVIADLQAMQERRNAASKEIGAAMGRKDMAAADALKAEVAGLKDKLAAGEAEQREAEAAIRAALETIPNIPAEGRAARRRRAWKRRISPPWRAADGQSSQPAAFRDCEALGLMDFEAASKMSGARFTVLKGQLARLERAIGQFMIDLHTIEHGYTEVSPPLLVKADAVYGVGQLPKFEEDLFKTTNDFYLTPTAEVTLTNLVREAIRDEKDLPLRFTALTPCFRSEAGAAGRDTRGMLRQHQFLKCELVSITTPETSNDEHERMLNCAETVLKRLGLHFRTMVLCTGDMGFGSRKTYDIEAWLPGRGPIARSPPARTAGISRRGAWRRATAPPTARARATSIR